MFHYARTTLYPMRWCFLVLCIATTVFFMLRFINTDDMLIDLWSSAESRSEATFGLYWFYAPAIVGILAAPFCVPIGRVIIALLFVMAIGVASNWHPRLDDANSAFSFKFAAMEHNPDHFFIQELDREIRTGNFHPMPKDARNIWFQKLSSKRVLDLRAWVQILNPQAPSVQYARKWLNSGYVPSAIYTELMSRFAYDTTAFQGTNVTPDQVVGLLDG